MHKILKIFFIASGCCLLFACSSNIQHYAQQQPVLDLQEYLQGSLEAWGIFQDRKGTVVRRFHVDMQASWQGNRGTLVENFTYSNGEQQQRIWHIEKLDQHHYRGRADDVVGHANGKAYGNALQWHYTLALEIDGSTYHVTFDDWMYLMDQRTLINRAVMKKFGITLGEVTLFFRRNGSLLTEGDTL